MDARVGIGYRRAHRAALLEAPKDERPEVLEVIPDHFFGDPSAIAPLAERYALVFHDVGLSIGTEGPNGRPNGRTERWRLERIRALAQLASPLLFSDHLAMTRAPNGVDLGHLCPLWYTRAALSLVVDRVHALQDLLGMPIALENIAAPFEIPGGEMTEPEFFHRVVEATGCGVLLDLTNLALNARNFGFDAAARLEEYPLGAVRQVHLAGGVRSHDWWVDSHSEPVDDASYRLLERLRGRSPLVAIVIERDDRLPELPALVAEARRAGDVWRNA